MRQAERAGQDRRRMQRVFDGDLDGLAESTLPMFVTQQSGRPVPAAEDLMWARRGGFVPDVLLVPSDGEDDAKGAATWQLPGSSDQDVINMAGQQLAGPGRLVVSRGTVLPSGPIDLGPHHLYGMGAGAATWLQWHTFDGEDLLTAGQVSNLRLSYFAGASYRWAISASTVVDVTTSGTVNIPGGSGHVAGLSCGGLRLSGGSAKVSGVNVGSGGLTFAGGFNRLAAVNVQGGPTVMSSGSNDWRGGDAAGALTVTGGNNALRLREAGAVVVSGSSNFFEVDNFYSSVTVEAGSGNTFSGRIVGTLTLESAGTRLLHVNLLGSFVDNGQPYFACGCQGIPNTCACGGGSSVHGHDLGDLTDVDLSATPVADPAHLLGLDGTTWKRATVTGGGTSSDGTVRQVVLHDYGTGLEPVTDVEGRWLYGAFPGLEF
jgi:hypothetical protein